MTPRRRWLTGAYAALSVADTVLVGLGRGRVACTTSSSRC